MRMFRISLYLASWVLASIAIAEPGKSIFDEDKWLPPTSSPPAALTPKADPQTPSPPDTPASSSVPKTPVPEPSVLPLLAGRATPPSAAAQADLLKLIRELFEKEYAATARDARRALAQQLQQEAAQIRRNEAARYVLLKESLDMAAAAGDATLCKQALAAIAEQFTGDTPSLGNDAAVKLLKQASADDAEILLFVADVSDRLVAADRYDAARKLASIVIGRDAARKDPGILARLKLAQSAAAEHEKLKAALATLEKKPDDPAANLAAGKFHVLVRNDWRTGLRFLVNSGKGKLHDVALRDKGEPAVADERFDLAGDWWAMGRENPALQARFEERAAHWYSLAAPELGDIKRALAEKRLAEVATRQPAAPGAEGHRRPTAPVTKALLKPVSTVGGIRLPLAQQEPVVKLSATGKVYLLEGEYRVAEGQRLEIEAGVTIVASARSRMIVQGTLRVCGSPEKPVEFRGGQGQVGWWKGILLEGAKETSLQCARIYDAETGVTVLKCEPTFNACVLANNGIGMSIGVYDSAKHSANLEDCVLAFNQSHGLTMHNASAAIRSCTIGRNGGWGLEGAYYVQPKIQDSVITSNRSGGICLAVYDCKLSAERCVLAGNGGLNIENKSTPEWDLRGNYWGPELTAFLKARKGGELPTVVGKVRVDEFLEQMPKRCGAMIREVNGQKLW